MGPWFRLFSLTGIVIAVDLVSFTFICLNVLCEWFFPSFFGLSSTGAVLVRAQPGAVLPCLSPDLQHIWPTLAGACFYSTVFFFQLDRMWAQTHSVCSSLLHHRVSLCSNLRTHTVTNSPYSVFVLCQLSFFLCTFAAFDFHALKWNHSTLPQVFTSQSLLKGSALLSLFNTRNHRVAPQQQSWFS